MKPYNVIDLFCGCSYDYNYCEGTPSEDNIPEETTEETEEESTEEKSTEEKVEEAMGPLTPDGNLTIVDDYGSLEAGGKTESCESFANDRNCY